MKVCLLGVEFHSPNRGCGALAYSICKILSDICDERKEKLFVSAILFQTAPVPFEGDKNIHVTCIRNTPKKLSFWRNCFQEFKTSDLVLDFSMGDSFSDIYGKKRFYLASALKELAILSGTPFIMAPQTIGPFSTTFPKIWAKHILKKCSHCFVRDKKSEVYTKEISGRSPLLTTDVAFVLPFEKQQFTKGNKLKIGFNPSGLLWFGTKDFSAKKHLTVDYKEYVERVMSAWSEDENVEIHLIPHVFSHVNGGGEDDLQACLKIQEMFPKAIVNTEFNTPMEIKSFISGMDVFIGARMHATIGAFSGGVATIPFSYSRKFEGLYSDLGYEYLISATVMSTDVAVQKTLEWVEKHEELRECVEVSKTKVPELQNVFINTIKTL